MFVKRLALRMHCRFDKVQSYCIGATKSRAFPEHSLFLAAGPATVMTLAEQLLCNVGMRLRNTTLALANSDTYRDGAHNRELSFLRFAT